MKKRHGIFLTIFSLVFFILVGVLMTEQTVNTVKADSTAPLPEDYNYSGTEWNQPSTVRIVDSTILNSLVDSRANGSTEITYSGETFIPKRETYKPTDRTWQGLPSIVKVENRLWVCWYSGGRKEPDPFNYVIMAYSDDEGKNWVEPYIIIDHPDLNGKNIMNVVPNMFVDSDGNMWLFYLQSYLWGVKFTNAGAPNIIDMTWEEPKIFSTFKTNQPPTTIINADGEEEWLFTSESMVGESHTNSTWIYSSKDKGTTWTIRAKIESSASSARKWPESQIVQTKSGKLILASRLEKGIGGGVEVSYSDDYGITWTPYAINLEQPFIGPGSKFFMLKLSSGNLLMVNHDTTSSRSNMTAYLSVDEGQTWPYKISLDDRDDVSYPSAYEQNGKIYIVWDKGRYIQKELRLTILTEDDIKRGNYLSDIANKRLLISKPTEYQDIVSINNSFENEMTYTIGTTSAKIKEILPTTFNITSTDGTVYTITGIWSSKGYKEDIEGYYTLKFIPNSLPEKIEDGYDILNTRIELVSEEEEPISNRGCKSNILVSSIMSIFLIIFGISFGIIGKIKQTKEEKG